MKQTAYLLGPMTGYPDFNRPAFHHWAEHLRHLGFKVINPAELDEKLGDCPRLEDYYRRDVPYVAKADLGVAMPGWRESRGATGEAWLIGVYLSRPILLLPDLTRLYESDLPRLCL